MAVGGVLLLGLIGVVIIAVRGSGESFSEATAAADGDPTSENRITAKLTVKKPPPAEASATERPVTAKLTIKNPPPAETSAAPIAPLRATSDTARKSREDARPKDVADWKRGDYEGAARDRDPRLVAALNYYGSHFAGKESAANFLVKLLELWASESASGSPPAAVPPAPRVTGFWGQAIGPGSASSVAQPNGAGNASFGEAVVAALVANGTPRTRQVLVDIAEGKIKTGDSQADVAALKALAAQRDPLGDDLLFRLATSTKGDNLPGQPSGKPTALESLALTQIAERGSESLAVRLAEVMLSPGTTKAVYDRLWTCLRQPRMENLNAQVKLYLSPRNERATRDWLEQSLATGNSAALTQLLGIPLISTPIGQPASVGRVPDTAIGASLVARTETPPGGVAPSFDPYRLADRLWTPGVVAAIDERLRKLDALDGRAPLLGLAAAIPDRGMRTAMLRTLQRHWGESPKQLTNFAAAWGADFEPGFLTVVKMLRRDEPSKSTVAAGARPGSRAGAKSLAGTQAASWSKTADLRQRVQIGQEWMAFSGELVLTACQRFRAAAEASPGERRASDTAGDDIALPFNLNPQAEVLAAYRLDWPEELRGKVAAAPTLRVRYVRTLQKAVPTAVLGYYGRQIATGKERMLAGGAWIDSITVDRQADRTRSIDVFVAKANKNVVGRMDQEQELTIEILTIECEAIVEAGPATNGQ